MKTLLAVALLVAFCSADWAQTVAPFGNEHLKLTVALRLNNMAYIKSLLEEVSNPFSPKYGQYLTRQRVAELTSPSWEVASQVAGYFTSRNITNHLSADHDLLSIQLDAATASTLFSASLSFYKHTETGRRIIRSTNGYKVPAEISQYVAAIGGLTGLPYVPPKLSPTAGTSITPPVIRTQYSITVPPKYPSNLQAVASFLGQYWRTADLQTFFSYYEPQMAGTNPINIGYNNNNMAGVEASLDVQFLTGVTENVDTWVYNTNGTLPGDNEPWMDWFATLESETTLPYVFSISYGDYASTIDEAFASSVNDEFAKFTASGHTFLLASGDSGVNCIRGTTVCNSFTALFPAESPYVIAVGGTNIVTTNEVGVSFSGGGFSKRFSRPSYQDTAVTAFLAKNTVPTTYFNPNGRGFPDVAALGENYAVVVYGKNMSVAGTSASTPTFASILSLINSMLLSSGHSPLGWANALLYSAAAATTSGSFVDITSGAAQDSGCCPYSFSTTAGWDPYTGLGVANFQKLANYALQAAAHKL
eukprot:TRINITY_DN90_c0_g1_i3.p1 TRINITY_DN90_c0_g1~~TRINITY_DN90_c0_g1_i3.p1  ORF type:complete len:552 (-),score=170.43 TRINITY_DN90_c0_g1_i3:72-1667(-)